MPFCQQLPFRNLLKALQFVLSEAANQSGVGLKIFCLKFGLLLCLRVCRAGLGSHTPIPHFPIFLPVSMSCTCIRPHPCTSAWQYGRLWCLPTLPQLYKNDHQLCRRKKSRILSTESYKLINTSIYHFITQMGQQRCVCLLWLHNKRRSKLESGMSNDIWNHGT